MRPLLFGGVAALVLVGCTRGDREAPPTEAPPDPLLPLHTFEETRRAATDFAALPASDRVLGPDPYLIRAVPGASPPRFLALLRGRDAVVLLDEALRELARLPAPASPTGLTLDKHGEAWVTGEQAQRIDHLRIEGDRLIAAGSIPLPGVLALRDLAWGPEGVLHVVEAHDGRLLTIPLDHPERRTSRVIGEGAFRVLRVGPWVIVDALLAHTVSMFSVDKEGLPQDVGVAPIHHDGPIWGFDASEGPRELWIVTGGVEDHPLDRTGGSFGYIDSFVSTYRLGTGDHAATRVATVNVSAEGVVTPKALVLRASEGSLSALVAGYGSDRLLDLQWPTEHPENVAIHRHQALPGIASLAAAGPGALVAATPLLDGFLRLDLASPDGLLPTLIPVLDKPSLDPPSPTPEARLGEALFFTTLMAPWNRADGPLSRFTCETCHFEGGVDGRVHATGRGDVHATTKPLLGLFNNRPHFSRALDPDLTTVAHAEFRVAGSLSDHDPWFSATPREASWLPLLGVPDSGLDPVSLRKALMTFLMGFTPRPNPAVLGRATLSPLETQGAAVFQRRCEGCHQARLVSDLPGSRVPPARWEGLILRREGPIVWARSDRRKTGVVPYVHEDGPRVPSLRRLYAKHPYFTSGSAMDLRSVLTRARFGAGEGEDAPFLHDGPKVSEAPGALDPAEIEALLAFLDLL